MQSQEVNDLGVKEWVFQSQGMVWADSGSDQAVTWHISWPF